LNGKQIYLYAVASGLFLALAFPPLPFSAFAFVGLVPLLFALENRPKHIFLTLYITFFIYHFGTNWWISSWQSETDPYLFVSGLATALVHPFFFFIPFVPYFFVKKRIGTAKALWFLPFYWAAFEWFHGLGELSYPWLALGYTQINNFYWVQFADLAGVTGVSFIIVLINVLILKIIFTIKSIGTKEPKTTKILTNPASLRFTVPLMLLIVVPYIYGAIRVDKFDHEKLLKSNEKINIGIVQASINPWRKWETSAMGQIGKHMQISDSLIASVPKLDAIVWSETGILYVNKETNFDHNFFIIRRWLDKYGISLISGFADMKLYKKGEKPSIAAKAFRGDSSMIYDSYNSLLLLNPAEVDKSPQIYHKMRLTPFGERIPYLEIFSFARKWLEWNVGISSWAIGQEQKNLILKTKDGKAITFAPVICIESIYPGFIREFVNMGAELIVIITNDAWYDYTFGPEQHFQIARMRAIETRRYVARCANTGVSGFIAANGETLLRAPQYQALGIALTIPVVNDNSVYTVYGDWIVNVSLFLALFSVILAFVKQK
jgi:apolipoprotein N-acyltransferase